MEKLQSIGQLEWLRNKILARSKTARTVVYVCLTGCRACGAPAVKHALEEEVKSQGLGSQDC